MNEQVPAAPSPLVNVPLGRRAVEALLPHASSWVQVDELLECVPSSLIRTRKMINADDPAILAHFPNGPLVFPGVLLIEFISQSAYLLARLSETSEAPASGLRFLARCSASFLTPALPGDCLTATVTHVEEVGAVTVYDGVITCGRRTVCRGRVFGARITDGAYSNES